MRLVATLVVLVASVAAPVAARADLVVAAEYSGAWTDSARAAGLQGTGFGLRLGWTFDLPLLRLEPELGATRWGLDPRGCANLGECPSVTLTQVFAGARASLDTVIAPGLYVRGSLGSAKPESGKSKFGTLAELGLFLDFRLLPLVEFGLHGWLGEPSFEGDLIDHIVRGVGAHVAVVL